MKSFLERTKRKLVKMTLSQGQKAAVCYAKIVLMVAKMT